MKTRKGTYDDIIYTDFGGLNVPEDDVECESFAIMTILIIYLLMRTIITYNCI